MSLIWLLLSIFLTNAARMPRIQTKGSVLLQMQTSLKNDKSLRRSTASHPRPHGSQLGQDLWVLDTLGTAVEGFFLDLGAHDGELLSNTRLLEKKGWQGICVEPFPTNFASRKCKIERSALAPHVGKAKFVKCSGWRSAISGFPRASGASSMKDDRDRRHCHDVEVQTKPLAKILRDNMAPRIIDYASLDIEGAELDVLKSFPFDAHCVRLWTVEHTSFRGADDNKNEIQNLLESQGCNVKEVEFDFYAQCRC